jgi:hypothetical protein
MTKTEAFLNISAKVIVTNTVKNALLEKKSSI